MRPPFPPLFFALTLSVLSSHAAAAPTIDPLWQKARQALDAAKTLVADEVGTDMEMMDGDGNSMGVMHIVEKISDWKDAEPVRTIVSNDNPQYAAVARTRFKIAVPDHPEKVLREGAGPRPVMDPAAGDCLHYEWKSRRIKKPGHMVPVSISTY